jgi:ribosomal protein S18 acetylase RimI-like enzyme
VTEEYPHIKRVELIARESNEEAIRFYESLGFSVEGKMKSRIRNVDGTLEADIPMAWIRV